MTSGQFDTAVDVKENLLEQQQTQISIDTVRITLKKGGLKLTVKVKNPLLKPGHAKARYAFAKEYQYWIVADWTRAIWSDETKINHFGSDGRKWCWKGQGTELKPNQVSGTMKHGGGCIMIWGCMTAQGPGFLTKIDGGLDAELYCNILEGELKDTIDWYDLECSKTK